MSLQTASLILKTSELTLGGDDANGTSYTWKNINLRNLLGDMYDKYDFYNLTLDTICNLTSDVALGSTLAYDLNNYLTISGLPFINQSYNTSTGNVTNSTFLTPYNFVRSQANIYYYYNSKAFTFNKNQQSCNINITILRVSDNSKPIPGGVLLYPQMIFSFKIEGVFKTDYTNSNIKRMVE